MIPPTYLVSIFAVAKFRCVLLAVTRGG